MKKNPAVEWLKESVIYQIYPQSFQDSNGDGIGDLQGIISRLGYLKDLGVNTLWLNPCFDSPFGDAGYDVRNFYKIAPRYGTEQDMVELFNEAHRHGLRVILDLVAGHTSMDNEWFLKEAKDPKNPHSNRYIWKNRDFDSEKGPVKGDFVANYFWYQPALNFGYHEVKEDWQDPIDAPGPLKNRAELRSILKYWFDLGCDGFRVDMASSLVKSQVPDQVNQSTLDLWQDIRAWLDVDYPEKALVAEWSRPNESIANGFHIDFMMHFNAPGYPSLFFNGEGTLVNISGEPCYFSPAGRGEWGEFYTEYKKQLAACEGKGLISLPTANHDFQRMRVGERGWEGLRPACVFLMTQCGIPTIYYGDEIGMRQVSGSPPKEGSTLVDVDAVNAGTMADGERSGSRTPMQWDASINDGFSTAKAEVLYLPMDKEADRPTVATQQEDPNSLLHFVRKLLKLRVAHPGLGIRGTYDILSPKDTPYPLVIKRALEDQIYYIVLNPSDREQMLDLHLSSEDLKDLLNDGVEFREGKIISQAFSYAILLD